MTGSDQYVMVTAREEITSRLLVRLPADADATDADVIDAAISNGSYWHTSHDVHERQVYTPVEAVTAGDAATMNNPTPAIPDGLADQIRGALFGDSNDAEHDALYQVAAWLGLDQCAECAGLGYLLHQTYGETIPPDGGLTVQRCDGCDTFSGDLTAAEEAASHRGWDFGYDQHPGDGPGTIGERLDAWIHPTEGGPRTIPAATADDQ